MATADPAGQTPAVDDRGFFGHPKGLSVLFFSEMWERFSFYGMRALLVLYMVQELGYDEGARAYPVYGAYGALVYAFPVVGGWIANRWLGYRRSIVLGGALMAAGHFAMAIENTIGFYAALGLLCIGNGFFKPNISSTVGRLYKENDPRRDRGFTIFYMGINIGALAPLVVSPLGQGVDWGWGFGLAGIGMVIGLVWFTRGAKHIGQHGEPDDIDLLTRPAFLGLNRHAIIIIAATLSSIAAAYALYHFNVAQKIIQGVSLLVVAMLLYLTFKQDHVGKLRMLALMVLMVFHMLFWAGFEQAGSSFNVMTDEYVNRNVGGSEVPAGVFQAVNPAFIIIFAPLFSMLWGFLQKRKREPSVPLKFSLGLIQLGLGFLVLVYGISTADATTGVIGLIWMILTYLLHTTGEICLSPVGLSAVTKLAPRKWTGFCMGAWFLTIANAHLFAAFIAGLTGGNGDGEEELIGLAAVNQYADVFQQVAWLAIGGGVLLALLTPGLKKLMSGVE